MDNEVMSPEELAYDADCKAKNICPKCYGEGGDYSDDDGRMAWFSCYACGESGKYFPYGAPAVKS